MAVAVALAFLCKQLAVDLGIGRRPRSSNLPIRQRHINDFRFLRRCGWRRRRRRCLLGLVNLGIDPQGPGSKLRTPGQLDVLPQPARPCFCATHDNDALALLMALAIELALLQGARVVLIAARHGVSAIARPTIEAVMLYKIFKLGVADQRVKVPDPRRRHPARRARHERRDEGREEPEGAEAAPEGAARQKRRHLTNRHALIVEPNGVAIMHLWWLIPEDWHGRAELPPVVVDTAGAAVLLVPVALGKVLIGCQNHFCVGVRFPHHTRHVVRVLCAPEALTGSPCLPCLATHEATLPLPPWPTAFGSKARGQTGGRPARGRAR
mmetsp:Transcript_121291/g.314885  ORF Transcript_121291/g.314885 Transcript_121291/m.314885 type:complete len:324 (-) Transcript_121291:2-973(-)